jgi:hypothetical protein
MITSIGLQQLGFKSLSFHEDGDFRLQDDGAGVYIKEWNSASPQPTESEIETAEAAWHTANDYKFARSDAYPPIGDQLDALFHAGVFPADMAAQLQAVKDKYPND